MIALLLMAALSHKPNPLADRSYYDGKHQPCALLHHLKASESTMYVRPDWAWSRQDVAHYFDVHLLAAEPMWALYIYSDPAVRWKPQARNQGKIVIYPRFSRYDSDANGLDFLTRKAMEMCQ